MEIKQLEYENHNHRQKANELLANGEYKEALEILNKYLCDKSTKLEERQGVLTEIGLTYKKLCEFEKAKECFQLILDDSESLEMIKALIRIADVEIYLGQYPVARERLEKCQQQMKDHQNCSEYNEIMSSMNESLAFLSREKGEFKDALAFIENAIQFGQSQRESEALMKQHHHRGDIYLDASRIKESTEDLAKSLEMAVTLKGISHPDLIGILNSFAFLNSVNGRFKEGKVFIDRALTLSEKCFPRDHLQKARAYLNLGLYHKKFNQYEEAIKNIETAKNMYISILGGNHPQVAVSTNYLCTIYYEQGDYTRAKEGLTEALEANVKILGEKHPNIGDSYRRIGCLHKEEGKYNEAFGYFEKALGIFLDTFGPSHEMLASSYSDIGTIFYRLDNQSEALDNYKKALEISFGIFGENHPNVAREYHNLGMIYGDLGNKSLEIKYYKRALRIEKAIFGKNHTNIADTYQNLGVVYGEMGMLEKALEKHEKSLGMRLQVFGNKHPSISSSYYGLGYIYAEQKNYEKAMQFFGKSVRLREEFYGRCHLKTANCFQSMGFLFEQVKCFQDSKKFFLKSYQGKKKINCQSQTSLQNLARTIDFIDRDIALSEKNWPSANIF